MTVEEVDATLLNDKQFLESPFYSNYEPKEVLGRGLASVVRRCVEKSTKISYAVKIIDLTRSDNSNQVREAGYNEINLLRACSDHPYIIHLHDSFETQAYLFLIFELCPNGELFDLLTVKVRLSEKRARTIMRQLLESLSHLHSHHIMHRDIKCENILLDKDINVKLSDFGFATVVNENINYRELVGTPGYLSPEMLKANADKSYPSYGCAVDMWACGVVLYTLIAGRAPFYNRRVVYMLREIKDGRYSFPSSEWEEVSSECKDLIKKMLTVEPTHRITAKEALLHPFIETSDTESEKTAKRKVKCAYHVIRFLTRLKILAATPKPLSTTILSNNPYQHKPLRKLIDAAAFNIYGHWVQRSDDQDRGALFQCHPKSHQTTKVDRIRLLSGAENDI